MRLLLASLGDMDIFLDLDGTLIDSADGILESLRHSFTVNGIALPEAGRILIGPPLATTVRQLLGREDASLEARIAEAFKNHYDQQGCLQSRTYPTVPECLRAWQVQGHRLILVTNKRRSPTLRVLEHLSLLDCFLGIHCIDGSVPPASSKTVLLGSALAAHWSNPMSSLMIGDGEDDGRAAHHHGLRFVHAGYGYGKVEDPLIPVALRIRRLAEFEPSAMQAQRTAGYPGDTRLRGPA